jgi:uncharacterized membrane protein (DUF441 family)
LGHVGIVILTGGFDNSVVYRKIKKMTIIEKLLSSTRIQAIIGAILLAFIQKNFPQFSPDEATVQYLIGSIVALILGDSFRPVDATKKK